MSFYESDHCFGTQMDWKNLNPPIISRYSHTKLGTILVPYFTAIPCMKSSTIHCQTTNQALEAHIGLDLKNKKPILHES